MRIFTIADLHLSFGIPGKSMAIFGDAWKDHPKLLAEKWDSLITPDDLVLIPGDISWAMKTEQAAPDLAWVDARPGKKILIRGNHDYWWDSISKVRKTLPQSVTAIQNDSITIGEIVIAGARLWDTPEYSFSSIIDFKENSASNKNKDLSSPEEDEQLFMRELQRLEMSLKSMPKEAKLKIAMTHYPPIGLDLAPSRASKLLEEFGISICVFGHLHGIREGTPQLFGEARGIRYVLASCDWLRSTPALIA